MWNLLAEDIIHMSSNLHECVQYKSSYTLVNGQRSIYIILDQIFSSNDKTNNQPLHNG